MLAPAMRPLAEAIAPHEIIVDCGGGGRCGPNSAAFSLQCLGRFSGDGDALRAAVISHAETLLARGAVFARTNRAGEELTVRDYLKASLLSWPPEARRGRAASAEAWLELAAMQTTWIDEAFLAIMADGFQSEIEYRAVTSDGELTRGGLISPFDSEPVCRIVLALWVQQHYAAIVRTSASAVPVELTLRAGEAPPTANGFDPRLVPTTLQLLHLLEESATLATEGCERVSPRASEVPKGTECLASTRMVRGQSAKGSPEETKVGEMRGTGSHIHAHVSDRAPATVTMPLDATANALGALSATVRLINRSARFGLRTLRTLLACEARRQSLYRGVWQQNASDLRPPRDEELGLGVCPSALGNSASWMQPSPPPASAAQSMQHVLRPVPQRRHTFSAQSLHPPAGRAPPTLHSAHLSASSASAFTELPRAAAQRQPQRSPAAASAANEPPPPPSSSAPPSADQLASVHALLDHLNAHDTPPPTSITAGVAAAHGTSRPHASTHRAIAAAAYAATHPQTPCSDLPAQFAASARSLSTWRVKLHPTLSLATAARHCTQLHAAGQLRALSDEERGEGVAASAFCTSASQPLYPAATARRVLVLFSGPYERADGLGQYLSESGFEVTLADNNPAHGDASHDILDDAFFQHQLHLVNSG